jgi:hypothetical protein
VTQLETFTYDEMKAAVEAAHALEIEMPPWLLD